VILDEFIFTVPHATPVNDAIPAELTLNKLLDMLFTINPPTDIPVNVPPPLTIIPLNVPIPDEML
jgi:hypothetical protein